MYNIFCPGFTLFIKYSKSDSCLFRTIVSQCCGILLSLVLVLGWSRAYIEYTLWLKWWMHLYAKARNNATNIVFGDRGGLRWLRFLFMQSKLVVTSQKHWHSGSHLLINKANTPGGENFSTDLLSQELAPHPQGVSLSLSSWELENVLATKARENQGQSEPAIDNNPSLTCHVAHCRLLTADRHDVPRQQMKQQKLMTCFTTIQNGGALCADHKLFGFQPSKYCKR